MSTDTENRDPTTSDDNSQWKEILNIIVLALAAFAITWCSYQSTLWNGIQTFSMARSTAAFRMAQEEEMTIMQTQLTDATIIVNFVDAVLARDTSRASEYIKHTRPELAPVLADWLAENPLHNKNAAFHPAATNEYKRLVQHSFVAVEKLQTEGNDRWREAETANEHTDSYVFLTVIFSIVMFLAGLAAKMANRKMAFIVNFISASLLVVMLLVLAIKMPLAGTYKKKSASVELPDSFGPEQQAIN